MATMSKICHGFWGELALQISCSLVTVYTTKKWEMNWLGTGEEVSWLGYFNWFQEVRSATKLLQTWEMVCHQISPLNTLTFKQALRYPRSLPQDMHGTTNMPWADLGATYQSSKFPVLSIKNIMVIILWQDLTCRYDQAAANAASWAVCFKYVPCSVGWNKQ